jgi:hypothetical protein
MLYHFQITNLLVVHFEKQNSEILKLILIRSAFTLIRTIEIGADRFKVPDVLFNPSLALVNI